MLHSTLPRAFLTPGLKYLSSYYGEDAAPYQSSSYPAAYEEHYPQITEHHVFSTWHTVQRSVSPYPLDLSLKPSRVQENEFQDEARSRSYILDVEEDPESKNIVSKHHGHDEPGIIPRDDGENILEMDHENVRTGVYTDEEIPLHSPRYQTIPTDLNLQSSAVQGYTHDEILMTPQHQLQGIHAPMTPPSTPSPPQCPRKKQREELQSSAISPPANKSSRQISSVEKPPRLKKKHARRLKFDEDTTSPVSGTVILGPDEGVVTGDIDPAFNIVKVTEKARARLAKIENRLGPYQCRLCRKLHEDAFQLAQHRCPRIANVVYRCPECDKRFSCPANLASHRRWHKPKVPAVEESATPLTSVGAGQPTVANSAKDFSCSRCDAKFGRQAALRKHIANHHSEVVSNCNSDTGISNNGRNSAASNTSGSSIVGNVEQVINHAGNHLGVSPLTVEMP